jgi:hypothetical protein
MNTAQHYARALHALVRDNPRKGHTYLKNLVASLERRGHGKLLPRIFAAYQTLELKAKRRALHTTVTPQKERTRILLELYRTLIRHG